MKTISCDVELYPDGQMILPPDILKKINIKKKSKCRIIIVNKENSENKLSRFCGKWKDDRDADEIISDIYENRTENIRSEKVEL